MGVVAGEVVVEDVVVVVVFVAEAGFSETAKVTLLPLFLLMLLELIADFVADTGGIELFGLELPLISERM
jgi:hypothetical protein